MVRQLLLPLFVCALMLVALPGCRDDDDGSKRSSSGSNGTTGSGSTGTGGPGTSPGGSNTAPSVQLTSPQGPQVAEVELGITVIDAESHPVDLIVEYSLDGQSWQEATSAVGGSGKVALQSAPAGVAHVFHWDSMTDLPATNDLQVHLRVTPIDPLTGPAAVSDEFPLLNWGRQDPDAAYDNHPDSLVIACRVAGGFVPWTYAVNRVDRVRIYGDGRVVFTDENDYAGMTQIHQGWLYERDLVALLLYLNEQGFWGFQDYYHAPMTPTDMPSWTTTINLAARAHESGSYGGQMSAPAGFMEIFEQLTHPVLQPNQVATYVRQTITSNDLANGYYSGQEYEKKLDTPMDWYWESSTTRWRAP